MAGMTASSSDAQEAGQREDGFEGPSDRSNVADGVAPFAEAASSSNKGSIRHREGTPLRVGPFPVWHP
jgi:hypothetical protein